MGGGESAARCSEILSSLRFSQVLRLPYNMITRVPASISNWDVEN
jgi:hypothetical protein